MIIRRSLIAVVVATSTLVPAIAAAPAAGAVDCSRPLVVGVRGSGETRHSYGGYGKSVKVAIDAFTRRFGAGYDKVPIDYPAESIDLLMPWNRKYDPRKYFAGADIGIDVLKTTIGLRRNSCGLGTAIVLFGYSQGALVVNQTLKELADTDLGTIVGVGLLADPARVGTDPWNTGTANSATNGAAQTAAITNGSMPSVLGARITSACVDGDQVCAFDARRQTPGTATKLHTKSYADGGWSTTVGSRVGDIVKSPPFEGRWRAPEVLGPFDPGNFESVDPCPLGTASVRFEARVLDRPDLGDWGDVGLSYAFNPRDRSWATADVHAGVWRGILEWRVLCLTSGQIVIGAYDTKQILHNP